MKVYVVEWSSQYGWEYSNGVVGVYSTKEKATLAGNTYIATETDCEFDILEIEVDE